MSIKHNSYFNGDVEHPQLVDETTEDLGRFFLGDEDLEDESLYVKSGDAELDALIQKMIERAKATGKTMIASAASIERFEIPRSSRPILQAKLVVQPRDNENEVSLRWVSELGRQREKLRVNKRHLESYEDMEAIAQEMAAEAERRREPVTFIVTFTRHIVHNGVDQRHGGSLMLTAWPDNNWHAVMRQYEAQKEDWREKLRRYLGPCNCEDCVERRWRRLGSLVYGDDVLRR